jgi:hypothetical protein
MIREVERDRRERGKGREEPRVGETKPSSHTKPNHQVEIFDVRYTENDHLDDRRMEAGRKRATWKKMIPNLAITRQQRRLGAN